jgi:pimeloyl-ACP methyl ester carboxylesterase
MPPAPPAPAAPTASWEVFPPTSAAPTFVPGSPGWHRGRILGLAAGLVLVVVFLAAIGTVVVREIVGWFDDPYTVEAWQAANPAREGRDTSTLPLLERHDCPFANEPFGSDVECATLVVRADRRAGADPTEVVELAVAILRAHGEARPDPVLYLEGGPGGPSVAWFDEWVQDGWPSQRDRDLILLDQRGTGYSSPQLGCPEFLEAVAFEERASMQLCHERFVSAGIDLSTVSTPEHAADVEDLRLVLGIDRWNLVGTSYGSRVALRVMDLFPEGVRSVVLDSAYPPEVEALYHEAEVAAAAIDALFAACAADASCARSYPGLADAFDRAVGRLDSAPVEVDGLLTSGDDLVHGVVQSLYDPSLIAELPRVISSVEADPAGSMEELFDGLGYLGNGRPRSTVPAWRESDGTFYSVECREEAATIDTELARARAERVGGPAANGLGRQVRLTIDICARWGSGKAEPWERDPVVSDIPTLVLAGAFDPVTPPSWGQLAASRLSNSTYVEFDDLGHAMILGGSCPLSLIEQHIQRPGDDVDASCSVGRSIQWSTD